jgi:hypothetical protein
MDNIKLEELKYPVGAFKFGEELDSSAIEAEIRAIEELPQRLREAVKGMTDEQLDTVYRPGGWTVRQVVHHLADSHVNSYIRFRWALTEDTPDIKTYYEDRWAELPDAKTADTEVSLALLEALHRRWVILLRALTPEMYMKAFNHPENGRVTLKNAIALYSWHCRHHLAHIEKLKERMGL